MEMFKKNVGIKEIILKITPGTSPIEFYVWNDGNITFILDKLLIFI